MPTKLASDMDNNTAVWLSKMADPVTLTGPQIRLTTPEFDWERVGRSDGTWS